MVGQKQKEFLLKQVLLPTLYENDGRKKNVRQRTTCKISSQSKYNFILSTVESTK